MDVKILLIVEISNIQELMNNFKSWFKELSDLIFKS